MPCNNIVFRSHLVTLKVCYGDILYCKADSSYSVVYLEDGSSITVSKVLKKVELLLPSDHFCRCHKSFLVNREKVKSYNHVKNSLILKNGAEIPVALRRIRKVFNHVFSE